MQEKYFMNRNWIWYPVGTEQIQRRFTPWRWYFTKTVVFCFVQLRLQLLSVNSKYKVEPYPEFFAVSVFIDCCLTAEIKIL